MNDRKQDLIAKLIDRHFSEKYSPEVKKVREAVLHEMSCDNPNHNHNIIKVSWIPQDEDSNL